MSDIIRMLRIVLVTVGLLVAAFVLGVVVLGRILSVPGYRGPTSDHFDGTRFQNQNSTEHGRFADLIRWMLTRDSGPWRDPVVLPPGPAPPRRVDAGRLRVTFINHSTTLVQMDGVNILTDPVWSARASPVSWAGPRRVVPPGIRFEDLPPIDVVLLSHNHYDHLDPATLRRLAREHRPRFVVALGNGGFLDRKGVGGSQELDWWQSVEIREGVRITAVPAQHFSSRGVFDRDRTLWAGFVISGPAGSVYFAGDTGFGPHFEQVRDRYGPIRLALLPIGAFRPAWFMSRVHVSPDDAVRAHQVLAANTSVATHFGTFRLADDGQDEAPARLAEVLAGASAPRPRFWILGFGEGRDVP